MLVYTGGTFDIPHIGHVNFLRTCRKIAGIDKVIVALNTDEFIMEYKGFKPLYSFAERKSFLESLEYVDVVIPNTHGADSKPSIMAVKPDCIVIGSDWATKDYYKQMNFTQEWLDKQHITLIYVPYYTGISCTDIKRRVKNVK